MIDERISKLQRCILKVIRYCNKHNKLAHKPRIYDKVIEYLKSSKSGMPRDDVMARSLNNLQYKGYVKSKRYSKNECYKRNKIGFWHHPRPTYGNRYGFVLTPKGKRKIE